MVLSDGTCSLHSGQSNPTILLGFSTMQRLMRHCPHRVWLQGRRRGCFGPVSLYGSKQTLHFRDPSVSFDAMVQACFALFLRDFSVLSQGNNWLTVCTCAGAEHKDLPMRKLIMCNHALHCSVEMCAATVGQQCTESHEASLDPPQFFVDVK